jgi:hypothetical protein
MRKKYIFLFTLILFLETSLIFSQVQLEWVRKFPDSISVKNIRAYLQASALDDSGNIYTTGIADINNLYNFCTIKYNQSGTRMWTAYYSGTNDGGRIPYAIAVDKFYNVYVAGYDFREGSYFDYCTVKYNILGNQEWVRFYDGPVHGIDQASQISCDNMGNIYVSGFITMTYGNSVSFATLKYSTDGELIWYKIGGYISGVADLNGLVVDKNGYIYITGLNKYHALTIKYDTSGTILWQNEYPSIGQAAGANSIALDKFNNIYITGFSTIGTPTLYDCITIKYSSDGTQEWVKKYNPDSNTASTYIGKVIKTDNSNNVYVYGINIPYQGNGLSNIFIAKYSANGDLIWDKRENDTLANPNVYISTDSLNNFYTFNSLRLSNYINSVNLKKYNPSGIVLWSQNYIDSNTAPSSLLIDNNKIYLTGTSSRKIFTIKYSQLLGINNISTSASQDFILRQNYPNPFNGKTIINYTINKAGNIKLIVYDILGKEIKTLVNEYKKPGIYKIEWDASEFASGLYFYKLDAGNYRVVKKMLLVK